MNNMLESVDDEDPFNGGSAAYIGVREIVVGESAPGGNIPVSRDKRQANWSTNYSSLTIKNAGPAQQQLEELKRGAAADLDVAKSSLTIEKDATVEADKKGASEVPVSSKVTI